MSSDIRTSSIENNAWEAAVGATISSPDEVMIDDDSLCVASWFVCALGCDGMVVVSVLGVEKSIRRERFY